MDGFAYLFAVDARIQQDVEQQFFPLCRYLRTLDLALVHEAYVDVRRLVLSVQYRLIEAFEAVVREGHLSFSVST